jgi:hypothetical protein
MTQRQPVPILPERPSSRALSIAKGITALGRQVLSGDPTSRVTEGGWRADPVAKSIVERGTIEKTAAVPASTASGVWGANIVDQINISTLGALAGPMSACGGVFSRALHVDLAGLYAIKVPYITPASTNVAFVAQGAPMPVLQLSTNDGPTLTSKKLAFVTTMTREVFEHTNAEAMVRDIMARNLSLGIDSILFDSTAADTTRPAGLLTGLSTLGAKSGGGITAMEVDLAKLAGTVAAVGGLEVIFVAGPQSAAAIRVYQPQFPYPVYASAALAADTVVCIAPSAIVVAGGDAPKIDVSIETVLHMESTPLPLTTATSASFPQLSTFQSDVVAVRLRCDVDWAVRAAGAAAFISSVTW